MLLKNLVRRLPAANVKGRLNREIIGIEYDSRRVMPGMVYVAIRGHQVDGHEFISAAIERGATAVICERQGLLGGRVTNIRVPDAREALACAAISFYQHPSARLKVIAITGTNGQTVVAFLVKAMLEAAGIKTGLISSVQHEMGARVIPAQRTTPQSLDLQHLMAQMLKAGCRACVLEVSPAALDQKRLLGIEFDVVIFTNLTQDPIDYDGSRENHFAIKQRWSATLTRGSKPGAAIINIDDAPGAWLSARAEAEVRLRYGFKPAACLRATRMELGPAGSRFGVETPHRKFTCRLPLIGRHNVHNALAAVGAGLALGVSDRTIQSALNTMPPVPGRLEVLALGQPFGVVVDYAHTDEALKHVLTALREITPGRLLLVFGCGGNRDASKRARMGRVAAQQADFTLITSDNPRKENPAVIAAQIEQGYRAVSAERYGVELDRQRAIQQILGQAEPGDTVLIAGKGHETYQEIEDTIVPFDDRLMAQETLETLGFKPRHPR